jgi:hypothetical protein
LQFPEAGSATAQTAVNQGDQIRLRKKIAQNMAQPIFYQNIFCLSGSGEKIAQKCRLFMYTIFKNSPTIEIVLLCEKSPNLVTLPRRQIGVQLMKLT